MTNSHPHNNSRLRQYIERLEIIIEEKKDLLVQIGEIYAEAKSEGFDPKIMRMIIKLRKMKDHEIREQEMLIDTYMNALNSQNTF